MEQIRGKKTIRKISNAIDKIVMIPFLLLFLLGGYAIIDTIYVYRHAQDKSILQYKPQNGDDDTDVLENNVAWLTVYDTNIDYPIMQGKDNEEYLNKDPYGDFSLSGSIFLDTRNSPDFSDRYSLVYGHHMEYGTMFGALDDFKDENYLKKHSKGKLIVKKDKYKIEFFACGTFKATDEVIADPELINDEALINQIDQDSEITKNTAIKTAGKRILALSTCQDQKNDNRTVLFGVLKPEKEKRKK